MTRGAKVIASLVVVGLAVAVAASVSSRSSDSSVGDVSGTSTTVDPDLAAKAQDHCWFNVRSRVARTYPTRDPGSVSSSNARTERRGDLLIVTGVIEPSVGDDRFYGCSLFDTPRGRRS